MTAASPLDILEAALDEAPQARAALVERACDGDAGLRAQVMALLEAHDRSAGFLEPVQAPPQTVGAYRLIRQLGAGGMGVVYLAERNDGAFEQKVAVKLLPGRFHGVEVRKLAEAERRFLAALDHPNVARILDGGTTARGEPYVVMEYVDGEPIDAHARRQRLSLRARVELFGQVLAAVDAAHRALIIHRDLKPGNVLVTREGRAKLLDFGIAISLDGGGNAPPALTPSYASPEQLAGRPLTTASDVYGLGLILHELLAGRPAHAPDQRSLPEFREWLARHAPEPPSACLDAEGLGLASARAAASWRRAVEGDLDRIVARALDPEPKRRYASVQAFADDLVRWLEHRPVLAHHGGALYRLRKFLRRRQLPAAAAAVALAAVVGGAGMAWHQAWLARQAAERANRANAFLTGIISYGDPRVSGSPVRLVDALDHAAAQIPGQLSGQPQLEGDIRHALGEAYLGQERTEAAREQLERAAQLRAAEGGNDYAATLAVLAMLQWRLGDTEEAEALLKRALASCADDPSGARCRAATLGDYSGLLGDLGRFDEALPLAQESSHLNETLPGVPAANRAASWNNLATSYYGLRRFEQAQAAFERASELLDSIVPRPELDLSINYNNQSVLLHRMGRVDEAVRLAEASIALKRSVMGQDYPQLARPLSHLARYYAQTGRHDEAAAAIAEALRLAPQLYPSGDAKIGELHLTAAELALARADPEAARAQAEAARASFAAAPADPEQEQRLRTLLEKADAAVGAAAWPPQ